MGGCFSFSSGKRMCHHTNNKLTQATDELRRKAGVEHKKSTPLSPQL